MRNLVFGAVLASSLMLGAVHTSDAEAQRPKIQHCKKQAVPAIPELDPSGLASAASLVLAGALVLSHRRRVGPAA